MSRKIVRAIVIKDNKIAVIKRIKKDRTYYVFPGGGVEEGETFKEAIIREIKEELGVFVKVYGEIYKVLNLGELNTFMLCEIIEGDQTTPNMIQRISRIFERKPLISKEI